MNSLSSQSFQTTCEQGKPHEPFVKTNHTICKICKQEIHETSEGSGFWFTEEDDKNWDDEFN